MDAAKTGKLIREFRTEKALTQQELASILNVSPTAVSKWENGRALPDISMLESLVKVLNVTFAEIILGERAVRPAAETEVTVETPLYTNNMAEAAIKAMIDETISRKEKKVRKTVVMIAVGMTILAVLLFVTGVVWKIKNTPTLYLPELTPVSISSDEEPITIGDTVYVVYTGMSEVAFEKLMKGLDISDPAKLGKVIAYGRRTIQEWDYFCALEGTNGAWVLMFSDDRTGSPNAKNAINLYCTQEGLEHIPDWAKGLNN